MSRQVLTTLDFNAVGKIVGLPDGVNPQDAATVAQLSALASGLAWKDSVRVASTGNINLAAPGATIDGITMATNDRFLAKDETSVPTNGIYIWNGAAIPATRATDADTFVELESAIVTVEEGTANAGTTWRQTQVNGVIGTNNVVWAAFGTVSAAASETVAGIAEVATQAETDTGTDDARFITPLKLKNYTAKKLKYEGLLGDASATQYVVTHNLGTRGLVCSVYRNSGNYDEVECDVEHTTINTTTFRFNAAPSLNQFAYVILG
jgi:hypothetical protein